MKTFSHNHFISIFTSFTKYNELKYAITYFELNQPSVGSIDFSPLDACHTRDLHSPLLQTSISCYTNFILHTPISPTSRSLKDDLRIATHF